MRKFPSRVRMVSKRFLTVVKGMVGPSSGGGDSDIVDGTDFSTQNFFIEKNQNYGKTKMESGNFY